jgi:hypothetical protein
VPVEVIKLRVDVAKGMRVSAAGELIPEEVQELRTKDREERNMK